jgi:hypothetical protein
LHPSYDVGSAKGLKRIKSEEGIALRPFALSASAKSDAIAVLSGFKAREFDDQWNEKDTSLTPVQNMNTQPQQQSQLEYYGKLRLYLYCVLRAVNV